MASTTATAAPPRPSPWEQAPKGRGVSQGVILGGYDSRSAFGDGAIEELSDEALLAAFGSGDEKLAAVFVHRFQRQVYAVALSILGDPALSEDVAQQVFERAWRHGSGYDPRLGAVSVWMGAISRNLAIDTARRQRIHLDRSGGAVLARVGERRKHRALRDGRPGRRRPATRAADVAARAGACCGDGGNWRHVMQADCRERAYPARDR